MSVIVSGLEMPTNCLQCSFVRIVNNHYYCGCNANCMLGEYVGEYLEGVGRHEGCPLVELPVGHGRLIEANSLKETLDYYIREAGWDAKTNRVLGWVKDEFIDSERTIVEAEGE